MKHAAKETGANFKTSDLVMPDGQVPEYWLVVGAGERDFLAESGRDQRADHLRRNGVVAQLLERQAPSDQEFAGKKDEIRQSLLEAKQNELFEVFIANLRKDMEKSNRLKINQDEMKNLTRQPGTEGSEEGSE